MSSIFFQDSSFNQAIGNWDVSNVTSMAGMFKLADSFNQPIENWDVSKVTNMIFMFSGTTNFNQNLSSWNVDNVISCSDFSIDSPQWNEPKPNFSNCNPN
jgi:surface protein